LCLLKLKLTTEPFRDKGGVGVSDYEVGGDIINRDTCTPGKKYPFRSFGGWKGLEEYG